MTAALIIDIVVALVIWLFIMLGAKKGAVKTIYELGSFIVSAIVTGFVYKPATQWLLGLPMAEKWVNNLNESVLSKVGQNTSAQLESMPQWLGSAISDTVDGTANAVANGITQSIVSILCVIVVFLLVKLALSLVFRLLNGIMKLPVLKFFNKALGGILGGIKGIIILWVISAVLTLFTASGAMEGFKQPLSQTYIAKFLIDNNLLMKFIFGI